MADGEVQFRSGVIKPVECLKAGWELVKTDYWVFFGITAVGILLGSFAPFGILIGPMLCGIYYCFLHTMDGDSSKFENLFKGFDYFLPGFIVVLIQIAVMLVLMIPIYIFMAIGMFSVISVAAAGQKGPGAGVAVGSSMILIYIVFFLLIMAVTTLLHLCFLFTFPLIVERKLKAVDSIKLSIKGAKANLGGMIILLILSGLLLLIGVIFCYVGAFFVLPALFASFAHAYRQVFPKIEAVEVSE